MRWQVVAVALLLATATLCRAEEVDDDDDFDEERAVLIVRRALADERPLAGKQVAVTVSLYNAGNTPATGVKVKEAAWPEGFTVEGDLTASFDSIPAGSWVQHTYKVAAQEATAATVAATTVTYKPSDDEPEQTATSSVLFYRAFTVGESLQAKALELGSKLSGGNLNTVGDWKNAFLVGAVVVGAALAYRSYGAVSEKNRSRKRAKALAELAALEKDK